MGMRVAFLRRVLCIWSPFLLAPWLAAPLAGQQDTTGPGFELVGPAFVAIQAEDDAALAEWYANAFHLAEFGHRGAEDGRYSIRILRRGPLVLEIIRLRDAAPRPDGPGVGLFKVGLWVDDIDAAFQRLQDAGAETDRRVLMDERLGARMFVFRDPEGNRIQVFQSVG